MSSPLHRLIFSCSLIAAGAAVSVLTSCETTSTSSEFRHWSKDVELEQVRTFNLGGVELVLIRGVLPAGV